MKTSKAAEAGYADLFAPTLRLILSTHVDDLKGAGQLAYRKRLLDALEKKLGHLKLKAANFECVGVMHEQTGDCTDIWTHRQLYVPQTKDIPIEGTVVRQGRRGIRRIPQGILHVPGRRIGVADLNDARHVNLRRFLTATDPNTHSGARQTSQPASTLDQEEP